jgi:hypothetical protein
MVEEKLVITVDEEPEEQELEELKIKEYEVVLNVAQSMVAEHYFSIQGVLKAMIISNLEPMDISIISNTGWQLFEETQRVGTHYFPIKATALNYKGKQFNYVADDYYLNDGFKIMVKGPRNSNMKICLRYL